MADLDSCLAFTLPYEGGFVDDPRDPGGATCQGITFRTFTSWRIRQGDPAPTVDDLRNITSDEVEAIYEAMYFNVLNGAALPVGVGETVFDWGVNSGTGTAAKALQRRCGVTADGSIGPETLKAVAAQNPSGLVAALCNDRMLFLQSLSTWPTFGKGWTARVDALRQYAASRVAGLPPLPAPDTDPADALMDAEQTQLDGET
jgi:lysozyme family protein